MSGLLKGKVVLVTGGSRGIGRATVRAMAMEDASVIFNFNSSERPAYELVEQLTKAGQDVRTIQADVSSENDVKRLFHMIRDDKGRLDVLVNNAGVVGNNLLLMTSDKESQQIFDVNCKGSFLCLRAAAKMMMNAHSGSIINMSSVVGLNGNSGQVAYSASKAFIIGMTKSAAKELGQYNIRVNALAPGFIDTAMTANLKNEFKAKLLTNISLGRPGQPEDVARVAVFLASDSSSYVSGQILCVDGCQVM